MDFCEAEKKTVTRAGSPIGKQQLCVTLGWSRARLDRRIESDPGFPVLQRGTRGGGWLFDVSAVKTHIASVASTRRPGRPRTSSSEAVDYMDLNGIRAELAQAKIRHRNIGKCLQRLDDDLAHLEGQLRERAEHSQCSILESPVEK